MALVYGIPTVIGGEWAEEEDDVEVDIVGQKI